MKHLKVGDKAPDFALKDQVGVMHTLGDYKGKKLALYFYPRDSTPTCTVQACNLRDNLGALSTKGIMVWGIAEVVGRSNKKFDRKNRSTSPFWPEMTKRRVQDPKDVR